MFHKKAVQDEDGDYADSEAQRLLGNMYHHGHGVQKDLKKAKEWYEKAAKKYYGVMMRMTRGTMTRKLLKCSNVTNFKTYKYK